MSDNHKEYEYDVSFSFAGEDRAFVQRVADLLRAKNIKVFYDKYEQDDLWGKDLYQHLADVYQNKSRYCVVFLSKEYARKLWTKHELKSAQGRAFKENAEYLLPARFDDTEIPGISETVGYIDLRHMNETDFAQLILKKICGNKLDEEPTDQIASIDDKTSKFKFNILYIIVFFLIVIIATIYFVPDQKDDQYNFQEEDPPPPRKLDKLETVAVVPKNPTEEVSDLSWSCNCFLNEAAYPIELQAYTSFGQDGPDYSIEPKVLYPKETAFSCGKGDQYKVAYKRYQGGKIEQLAPFTFLGGYIYNELSEAINSDAYNKCTYQQFEINIESGKSDGRFWIISENLAKTKGSRELALFSSSEYEMK